MNQSVNPTQPTKTSTSSRWQQFWGRRSNHISRSRRRRATQWCQAWWFSRIRRIWTQRMRFISKSSCGTAAGTKMAIPTCIKRDASLHSYGQIRSEIFQKHETCSKVENWRVSAPSVHPQSIWSECKVVEEVQLHFVQRDFTIWRRRLLLLWKGNFKFGKRTYGRWYLAASDLGQQKVKLQKQLSHQQKEQISQRQSKRQKEPAEVFERVLQAEGRPRLRNYPRRSPEWHFKYIGLSSVWAW